MASNANDMLSLKGVSKKFGGLKAVDKIDLTVKEGTITALIGPNGAGKSTVINIITGVYPQTEGTLFFENACIDGVPTHKLVTMGIARTFQLARMFAGMSVLENVMVGGHSWATSSNFVPIVLNRPVVRAEKAKVLDYAMEMLKVVGIADKAHHMASNLPHGQQRLLELARSMATKPRLLLLDEPAAGLNPHEEDMLREALRSIVDKGITILLVEHHMRLVMSVSDWVHVIDLGRKIAEGTPQEIGKNPVVVKAYLGKEY